MDEKAADAKGLEPLKPELDRIAAVKRQGRAHRRDRAHAHDRRRTRCSPSIPSSDLHNADQVIAYIDQGGSRCRTATTTSRTIAKTVEMRKHLVEYATQMFTLAGQTPQQAAEVGADRAAHRDRAGQGRRWTAPCAATRRIATTR